MLRFPLDFLAIYARRFPNGLDVVYDTAYIYNLESITIPFRFRNYTQWFLTILFILSQINLTVIKNHKLLLLLILALPCLS